MLAESEQVVIGVVVVLVIVVVVAVIASQGQKGAELGKSIFDWRARMAALRDAGLPAADLDAWIKDGREILARIAVEKAGCSLSGNDSARDSYARMGEGIEADIRVFQAAAATANAGATQSKAPTVSELATLRAEGLITEDEFKAFGERFQKSPGAKATELVAAIRDLHAQHKAGAMSQGNYHASLWSMMDRLDREMGTG